MKNKLVIDINPSESISKAFAGDIYDNHYGLQKSAGSMGRTFENWDGNRTIKSEYLRRDYNYFRGGEIAGLDNRQSVLKACQDAYDRVGVIRNVIDLMSDFGCKGIRIRHEIPSVERFMQRWWEKVDGTHVSERFFNSLYRLGVVPIYKTLGKINSKTEKTYKSTKGKKVDQVVKLNKHDKGVIPIKYTFLNPAKVDVFAKELANFTGKNIYIMEISPTIKDVTTPFNIRNQRELIKNMMEGMPEDLKTIINNGQQYLILDDDRLEVFNYKKDDWQLWGKSIIYSILDDLAVLEKMRLADMSALDGAISNVRLWSLGRLTDNPQTTIIPTKSMIEKVRDVLSHNVGGGTMDLVWGPELTFTESNTQVHKFLGKEKYEPTLDSIYNGLGIPSALRSDKTSSGTGQFVSLKTLIERLNYGRSLLLKFWNEEFIAVQKSMGFSKPAVLEFDSAIIADEAAEKQLLINLADRGLISDEGVREKFGFTNSIEEKRIKTETAKRGDSMPHKASPFHNPMIEEDYNKVLLQGGGVAPSEVGINLKPKKDGEQSKMDMQAKMVKNKNQQQGENGRPKNITETSKRAPKKGDNFRVSKSQLDLFAWANKAQKEINDMVAPAFLHGYGKKNIRSFSKKEMAEFEFVKANILFNLEPGEKVSNSSIEEVIPHVSTFSDAITEILSGSATLEEKHNIFSLIIADNASEE